MTEFQGKSVVITGASGSIGRRLALDFASSGAAVVLHYGSSESAARTLLDEIERGGGRAILCQAELADKRSVEGLLDTTLKAFGRADVLVNNGAVNRDGPLLDLSEDDWRRVIDVNLNGAFFCIQAFGRAMVGAGGGVIVNISASTSIEGRKNGANYCASKAGLNMLTKCAALELAPRVRVNGLGLGFFASPLVDQLYSAEQQAAVQDATPLGRMGDFAEVSSTVRFFASQASGFITGQTVIIDGGRVRH